MAAVDQLGIVVKAIDEFSLTLGALDSRLRAAEGAITNTGQATNKANSSWTEFSAKINLVTAALSKVIDIGAAVGRGIFAVGSSLAKPATFLAVVGLSR